MMPMTMMMMMMMMPLDSLLHHVDRLSSCFLNQITVTWPLGWFECTRIPYNSSIFVI